jgi:hypothetical protein
VGLSKCNIRMDDVTIPRIMFILININTDYLRNFVIYFKRYSCIIRQLICSVMLDFFPPLSWYLIFRNECKATNTVPLRIHSATSGIFCDHLNPFGYSDRWTMNLRVTQSCLIMAIYGVCSSLYPALFRLWVITLSTNYREWFVGGGESVPPPRIKP